MNMRDLIGSPEYGDPENERAVRLDGRDWVRVLAGLMRGEGDLDDPHEADRLAVIIDQIIQQASLSEGDLIDVVAEHNEPR